MEYCIVVIVKKLVVYVITCINFKLMLNEGSCILKGGYILGCKLIYGERSRLVVF